MDEHVHEWRCVGGWVDDDPARWAGRVGRAIPRAAVVAGRDLGFGQDVAPVVAARVVTDGVPVGVGCEAPLELHCKVEDCRERRRIACGSSRLSRCQPCAIRYRQRVARVAGSGLVVGRLGGFVTLTAPGRRQHFKRNGEACRCTPDGGVDLEVWNAGAAGRWNRFVQALSRAMDADIVTFDDNGARRVEAGLVYFRATEAQKRGALHYHVLIRRRDRRPFAVRTSVVRRLAIAHGFGHEVDVARAEPGHSTYVAKYVSKAANVRGWVPWRREVVTPASERVDTTTGELTWHPEVREIRRRATYRTWTCSRSWGRTMSCVKADQQHWKLCVGALPRWDQTSESSPAWGLVTGIPPRPDGHD